MKKQMGFSLIELLIVVAIVLIIAAIAVPNYLRAQMSANESSAVASVRNIRTSESLYSDAYPSVGYAVQLGDMGGPRPCVAPTTTAACVLDNPIANAGPGTAGKSGYVFVAIGATSTGAAPNDGFVIGSAPASPGTTGIRLFCTTTDGVMRTDPTPGPPVSTIPACLNYAALN